MELHEYQKKAVRWLFGQPRSILSIDMGLGKTATVIEYLSILRPHSCLIVAPKRVAETVWMQEAVKWGKTDIADKMVIVSGSPAKRAKALEDTSKPYKIVGRDNLKDLKGWSFGCLIIDELTSFKNVESARSRVLATISAPIRIGMTGTFLANGAIDIYGQAQAVDIACKYGINFFAWRATYFRDALKGSGLQFAKWKPTCALEKILRPIAKEIFTLSAEDYLDIPDVTETEHPIRLNKEEREAYDTTEAFLGLTIGGEMLTVEEGAKFAKLQTLCNGFIYDKDGISHRADKSTKLEAVAEFCERCVGEGEQVLLFYGFRDEAAWLHEMLDARHVPNCSVDRKDFLERWNAGEAGVLMAHPASAGHGLNLQHGGHIIAWSSVTYNYELFAQANARLARQGQKKPVQIHYFNAEMTCEQAQRKALQTKDKEQKRFINLTK